MTRVESTVHWLHLSDFHFDAGKSWDRDRSVKALLEYLGERKKKGWHPDLVFATGDFANRGKREEFDQAILFFRKLSKVLDLDLARDLFLVPGNHDVDRSAKGPLDDAMVGALAGKHGADQQEEIAKVLGDAPTMRLLGRRLAEYYSFTERLLGSARRTEADRPWRTDLRDIRGVEVAVLQLNSAWACGKEREKGELLVGANQVEEALAQASSARLRFVLIHHPPDYLTDGDASFFRDLVQSRGSANFLLRGHLHESDLQLRVNPDGSVVELAAGAVYQGAGWPKRFLIGSSDTARSAGTVELLTYSQKGAGFWTVDSTSYRELRDGCLSFELRLDPGGGGRGKSNKASRNAKIVARYRAAVAAVHGQMRFIGFPSAAAGHRPNVGVQDLFVPLRLATGRNARRPDTHEELTTTTLLERLQAGAKIPGRFVVLGEPGSGKTTLCRFAAVFFAGELVRPQLAPQGQPLPLFLPFRDYVRRRREGGDCGILDYLVERTKHHLQVAGAGRDLLENSLELGEAILLLDGLDEVGNPQEREEMRDRVSAFCRQYPRLPMMITSRFSGYDDAPLSQRLFDRLELRPFEKEDLRTFVSNWYAVQEPIDPQARARGIVELLAAFDVEPRVRALAGNPLLATLIALVHRTEARLPGERAKLYELVVRTLLETWPTFARREFAEIDPGLQRSFLEDFALSRQERRSRPDSEVVFERLDLEHSLAELIARQQGAPLSLKFFRIAEAWVEHLAAGTGVIVEQRPGVFAFLHLSLLEYLAACALDRRTEALEVLVTRWIKDSTWRDVLLLAIGRHATDTPFLSRLFTRVAAAEKWEFLLLSLREEAAFDDASRHEILDVAARNLLSEGIYRWDLFREVAGTLERFSVRHGKAVSEWRQQKLNLSLGDDLRATVAGSFREPEETCKYLEARSDRAQAAADLLEFWPGSAVGDWAASRADIRVASDLLSSGPTELALPRALACCGAGIRLAAAAAPLQLEHSYRFFHLATTAIGKLSGLDRQGGRGIPRQVHTIHLPLTLVVGPRWPRPYCLPEGGGLHLEVRDFARDLMQVFTRDFSQGNSEDVAQGLAQDIGQYLTWDFAQYFAREFSREFADYFSRPFSQDFARDSARYSARDYAQDFARDFGLIFEHSMAAHAMTSFLRGTWRGVDSMQQSPATSSTAEDRRALAGFITAPGDKTYQTASLGVFNRRTAEAWIALVTTAGRSRDEAIAYLGHRLQNVALLYLWPALDRRLPTEPTQEQLALYLQLGWTQATTTHEWPATERWIRLLKFGPPDHWLPRAQWHLCWLLDDPSAAGHQLGFNKALREGLGDADLSRHELAKTLEKVIGFYP